MMISPSDDLLEIESRLLAVLRDFHVAIDRLRDALISERAKRFAELKARPGHGLTERELQILGMINEDPEVKNHRIATALGITTSTVKNTLHCAYLKLSVSGRKQAIKKVFRLVEMINAHETANS